jgi:hypothetical protein
LGKETALVAVNKHVDFTGPAATLELAETEVGEGTGRGATADNRVEETWKP